MQTSTDRAAGGSRPQAGPTVRRWDYPRIVAAAAGVFFLVAGLWALAAPRSFFDTLATFEPYNQHLIQDIGAFQIGLGAVLLLAVFHHDALATALLGVGAGSAAHVVSHVVGRDLGGSPETDIPFFSILTVLLVSGGLVRLRPGVLDRGRSGDRRRGGPH